MQQIALMASTFKADLVVIGSHHLRFLARTFAADKAPRILHAIGCPVLVYHEGTICNADIKTGKP